MPTTTSTSKSGVGVGSASIVLIFAVLCLTVFTLITYIVASNNIALVEAEAELVAGFYEADTLAEQVLAEILAAGALPERAHGVDISAGYDEQLEADTASYYCAISESKSLYVNLALRDDSYDILCWRMVDTDAWHADDGINVWIGE